MLAALKIFRSLGDPHYIALVMNFMVPTLINLGKCMEAKAFMQESIVLCEQSKNRWGLGTAYCYMGSAFTAEGEFKQAKTYLLQSLEIFGEYFEGWDIARSLAYLGEAIMRAGDLPEARRIYQEAFQVSLEANAIPIALDVLVGISELHAQGVQPENALLLCYFVLDHPAGEEETERRADQLRAALESKLNPIQNAAVRTKAKDITLDELASVVLDFA